MEEKKKFPKLSIILIIIGICLILFGVIGPQIIYRDERGSSQYTGTYNPEIDRNFDQHIVKIELNTSASLDTNITVFIDENEYSMTLIHIDGDTYKGSIIVYKDSFIRPEDIIVKAYTTSGDSISLTNVNPFASNGPVETVRGFSSKVGKVLLTVFPCVIGAFLILIGLISYFVSTKIKQTTLEVDEQGESTSGIFSSIVEKINPQSRFCGYCSCENDPKAKKCSQCGAPLKKK